MGQNFHKIEAVRLEGGDPLPPQAVSLTAFFPFFFFDAFPNEHGDSSLISSNYDNQSDLIIISNHIKYTYSNQPRTIFLLRAEDDLVEW